MLSKTVISVCRRCGSENIRLNGHADNGAQRAKCRECEKTFVLEPKGPRYDDAFKETVVRACQDRMSLRGITRTFGVCYETIMEWAGEKNPESAGTRGHAAAERKGRRARTR